MSKARMIKTATTHAQDALFRIWVIGEFEFVSDFGFGVSGLRYRLRFRSADILVGLGFDEDPEADKNVGAPCD